MRVGTLKAALATLALVAAANAAVAADDSGVHAFLSNLFGEAGGPAKAASAAPAVRTPIHHRIASVRPLTIRRAQPNLVAAVGPTKPPRISIYEDRTLRPGDAVMTADGIRIFAGSRSWPYAKADFVGLAQAHDLSRDTVKVLAALNTLPRT